MPKALFQQRPRRSGHDSPAKRLDYGFSSNLKRRIRARIIGAWRVSAGYSRPASLLAALTLASADAQERSATIPFHSEFLGGERIVRLYFPPSYFESTQKRYPVLYVHDGQNVFSSAGTNVAFGWGNWELDLTADKLSRAGQMREVILVAVDNSAARYQEYGGIARLQKPEQQSAFSNYCSFLVKELKPLIDTRYRTRREPTDTGVLGSSMGGICSFRLAWEHPEIFGLAASLSGAFQVETNLLLNVLRPYQGRPKPIRFYFDSGVVDFMGGDDGRQQTEAVVHELRRIGWRNDLMHYVDTNPLTIAELEHSGLRRDKWPEAQKSQHNEFYWRLRAGRALTFLFPPGGT